MLVIYFQFFRFNEDLGLELPGSFRQLWFTMGGCAGDQRLGKERRSWERGGDSFSLLQVLSASRQQQTQRCSLLYFLPALPAPSAQDLFRGQARPYRCSTMCGASCSTGLSISPTGPSSSPHLLPSIPLIPGMVDASCNSCCFSWCPRLLRQPANYCILPLNKNSLFEIPTMLWGFLPGH